jgi:hypothetical protein
MLSRLDEVDALPVYRIVGCVMCDTVVAILGTAESCRRALEDPPREYPAPPPDAAERVIQALNERGHAHDAPNEITTLAIYVHGLLQVTGVPLAFRIAFVE